jgi:PAS domain S-box-containing protein
VSEVKGFCYEQEPLVVSELVIKQGMTIQPLFLHIKRAFKASPKEIWGIVILTVIYLLAARFGLSFASFHPSASIIWPPTGIALAATILFGYRMGFGVFLGALIANVSATGAFFTSLLIAVGNTLEALVGAYLINSFAGGRRAFEHLWSSVRFIVFAGLVSTAVSATVGVLSIVLASSVMIAEFIPIWVTWWLGDMGGAILIAPLLILWISNPTTRLYFFKNKSNYAIIAEFALALVSLIIIGEIVFDSLITSLPTDYPLTFLIIPSLLWIALRFRRRATTLAIVIIAISSVHGTMQGFGPFGQLGIDRSLLLLQIFLIIISTTMLILTVLVTESIDAHKKLATKEKHFRSLIEKSSDGVILLNAKGIITYKSPRMVPILGYTPEELVGTPGTHLVYPSDDPNEQASAFSQFVTKPDAVETIEVRLDRKDGTKIWIESTKSNLLHDPDIEAVIVNFRDVTERKLMQEKKNQFISLLSHQLYTPLSSIRMYATSLLENRKQFSILDRKYIQEIDRSGQEMLKLVDSLLKISRIELGTLEMEPRMTELRKELDGVLRRMHPQLTSKEISLKRDYVSGNVPLTVDPVFFTSILSTLILEVVGCVPPKSVLTIALDTNHEHTVIKITPNGTNNSPKEKNRTGKANLFVARAIAAYMDIDIINDTDKPGGGMIVVLPISEIHKIS